MIQNKKKIIQKLANLANQLDKKGFYKLAEEIDKVTSDIKENDIEFINLTPHDITIGDFQVKKSGTVARVQTSEDQVTSINGIPVVKRKMGNPQGVPQPEPGKVFIVSSMVLSAFNGSGRTDVVAPDTGPTAKRDEAGQIKSVTRLVLPE